MGAWIFVAVGVLAISLSSPAGAQQDLDVVQCYCNGQYTVMPRGTDCRALCVGRGPSPGAPPVYTPPRVYQPSPAELARQRMNAVNEQGRTAFKHGDYRDAVRLFKDALALAADRGDALIIQHNIGNTYSFLASEAQKRGDLDEALSMLRQAMAYYPNEGQHDWPGWEKQLRDAIAARQQAAEQAAREDEARRRQAAELAIREAENQRRQSQLAEAEQSLQSARQQLETERLARAEDDLKSARRALQDTLQEQTPVGAGPNTKFFGKGPDVQPGEVVGHAVPTGPQSQYSSTYEQLSAAAKSAEAASCIFNGQAGCPAGQKFEPLKLSGNSPALQAMAAKIATNKALVGDQQFMERFNWYRHLDTQSSDTKTKLADVQRQIDSNQGDRKILNAMKGTLENTAKIIQDDQKKAKQSMDERAKTLSITLEWPPEEAVTKQTPAQQPPVGDATKDNKPSSQ